MLKWHLCRGSVVLSQKSVASAASVEPVLAMGRRLPGESSTQVDCVLSSIDREG